MSSSKFFKAKSVVDLSKRFKIEPPRYKTKEDTAKELLQEVEYKGPTVEEVEAEITERRTSWENSLRDMKRESSDEADRIIDDAKNQAFEIYKAKQIEAKEIIDNAKLEEKNIINQAKSEADEIIQNAKNIEAKTEKEGYDKGYEEGFDRAFEDGRLELARMISKVERILADTINKRNEIINMSETQLIEIAIQVAKRVIKMITEKDKTVIVRNIQDALRKVKGRAKVTIRVNIDDLEIAARHKEDFYKMLDKIDGVTILEDPNVDNGGCIIETDFGDIDARINTQLNEIETAIKEIEPIKDI